MARWFDFTFEVHFEDPLLRFQVAEALALLKTLVARGEDMAGEIAELTSTVDGVKASVAAATAALDALAAKIDAGVTPDLSEVTAASAALKAATSELDAAVARDARP